MTIEKLPFGYAHSLANGDPDELIKGARACVRFQRRVWLREAPQGNFSKAGMWYPSGRDAAVMSPDAPAPTRASPYTYYNACCSVEHCERLDGASDGTFRFIACITVELHSMVDEEQILRLQKEAILSLLPTETNEQPLPRL